MSLQATTARPDRVPQLVVQQVHGQRFILLFYTSFTILARSLQVHFALLALHGIPCVRLGTLFPSRSICGGDESIAGALSLCYHCLLQVLLSLYKC